MSKITEEQLAQWFTYHPLTPDTQAQYQTIRRQAHMFARIIIELCPPCADTTAAIRKVREAVMTANAAIACDADAS